MKILYAELQDRIKDKDVRDKCQNYLRTLVKTIMGLTQRKRSISKRLIDDYIMLSLLLSVGFLTKSTSLYLLICSTTQSLLRSMEGYLSMECQCLYLLGKPEYLCHRIYSM